MVIGVAGGYCSGKDTVARIFAELQWPVVDVDRLGHLALERRRREIVERFGSRVASAEGRIDRGRLGRLVFGDPEALAGLESIVHPVMVEMADREITRHHGTCVLNAAILYRMGLHRRCDLVVCVKAPLVLRYLRARRRDGAGWRRFLGVVRSQRGICPNKQASGVDTYSVRNAGGIRALARRVRTVAAMCGGPAGRPER